MPYVVRKDGPPGKPYCLYKETGGEALACHPILRDAERHRTAILISEYGRESKSLTSEAVPAEPRLGLLITSNAYRDRQGEIVRQKALEDWVGLAWKDDAFIADIPLLFWHNSEPVGDIVYAATHGPFLVEVARERPDGPVNLMTPSGPPVMTTVKSLWDLVEDTPGAWGASPEFFYRRAGVGSDEIVQILDTESSFLPSWWAANAYTLFTVL